MVHIRCSALRGWSCAITKSFEFWLRTVEKMGLILSPNAWTPWPYANTPWPVKLLSQLGLSFSPPCSTNSSMGLSRYKRIRFRLQVLDSVYCPYWAVQSCRPTIWTKDSRDTSLVLSELWHDRGRRRRINSGDSMAYEYAISGRFLD